MPIMKVSAIVRPSSGIGAGRVPWWGGARFLRRAGKTARLVLLRRFSGLLARGLAEAALHHILGIGVHRAIAPEPAHHLRQNHAAEFLAVEVHAPRVIHVVPLLRESLHEPDVLIKPVALLVIRPVGAER